MERSSPPVDRTNWVTICGGPGPRRSEGPSWVADVVFDFGPRAGLTEDQLKTITWLQHWRARTTMKKNRVRAEFIGMTHERYCQVIELLEKDGIAFEVN